MLCRNLLADNRTPLPAKILLYAAVAYLLMPFDLIPDFIPVPGQLDDLIVAGSLIYIVFIVFPNELVQLHKLKLKTA